MDAKTFIRRYEELKQKNDGSTLAKLIELEKEWRNLYNEMNMQIREMSKRQKKELERFIIKSYQEAKNFSLDIFISLTEESEESFYALFEKWETRYLNEGVKIIVENYLKTKGKEIFFEDLLQKKQKEEKVMLLTEGEWMEKAATLLNQNYSTLEEAFLMEEISKELFLWWNKNKNEMKGDCLLFSRYITLTKHRMDLTNFMLKQMGYTFSIQEYEKEEEEWEILYLEGLIAFLEFAEEKKKEKSLLMEELLSHISFVHPRDEFKHVRKMKRHFVFRVGPTNSGKTHHAIRSLKEARTGIYLAPIRLLASEIQEKLIASRVPCDLVTGESEVRVKNANHISSTVEMANLNREFEVAVIDEIQMIEDEKRGNAWLRAIFGLKAKEIHLCGASHSIDFITKLIEECGDTYEIHYYERKTSLILEEEEFKFPHSVQDGDALIVFSKKRVLEVAKELQQNGIKVSMLYGKLPPDARKRQVEMFARKETKVMVATDVIGIGLNLPIRRVVFLDTEKFDGVKDRPLTVQEVKQIAGRAGRRGHYEVGLVNAVSNKNEFKEKLNQKEDSIQKSVIVPTSKLTQLEIGTLRQRLLAWKKADLHVNYLEKANIDEQLDLLKEVEKWEHELDSEMLFKALYIPFRSEIRELRILWVQYVEELKKGKNKLTKPTYLGNSLHLLEIYYQQILLYFNFSKKFKLYMDREWMEEEKKRVTGMINRMIRHSNYKKAI